MALDQEQIEGLINRIVHKSKDSVGVSYHMGHVVVDQKYIPEYYSGYRKAVKQMRRISPHANVDVFPAELFAHRAPNQSDEEANYLRNTYRCTTHPVFVDYVNSVSQGLNEGNWSWEFANEDGDIDLFQDYLQSGVPVYGSIEVFVKTMLPALKAKDANGVLAVKPRSFKTVIDDDGNEVIDDRAMNEPLPFYFNSAQVVGYKDDEYVIVEMSERSPVMYGNKKQRIGRIFEIYDDTNIWRAVQVGKYNEHKFEYFVYFNHDMGQIPATRLMGIPSVQDDGQVYWTSPFYHAVDLLDRALAKDNNIEVSITRVVFPTAIIDADECDFRNEKGSCHGGYWMDSNGNSDGMCSSCNGTGFKMNLSPFKNYYKKRQTGVDAGGDTGVPLQFVTPDTAGLDFVQKSSFADKVDARSMLHLRSTNTDVSGRETETATVAAIDQKQHYKFVKPINDQTFDLFEWMVDMMRWQRYGDTKESPSFNRPKSFDFRTTNDYLADIELARKAGLPDSVVNLLIFKFFRSMHFGNSQTAKAIDLMAKADRLLTVSADDIAVKLSQRVVEPWEVVLHDSVTHIVTSLILEDPTLFDLSLDEQIARVQAKAKELAIDNDTSTTTVIDLLATRGNNGTSG